MTFLVVLRYIRIGAKGHPRQGPWLRGLGGLQRLYQRRLQRQGCGGGKHFSTVLFIATLHRKYFRPLTLRILFFVPAHDAHLPPAHQERDNPHSDLLRCVHACVHACIYTHTHTHTNTHTHTHTQAMTMPSAPRLARSCGCGVWASPPRLGSPGIRTGRSRAIRWSSRACASALCMVQATWCLLPARSRLSKCFPTFSNKSRGEGGRGWAPES